MKRIFTIRNKIILINISLIIIMLYLFNYERLNNLVKADNTIINVNTINSENPLSIDSDDNYIEIKNKLAKQVIKYQTNEKVLSKYVGIVQHSVMFNKPGQTILSGHREGVFNGLKKVKHNDVIDIFFNNEYYKYKVYKIYQVKENEGYLVYDNELKDNELVLITCYPIDDNTPNPSLRLIIKAKLM